MDSGCFPFTHHFDHGKTMSQLAPYRMSGEPNQIPWKANQPRTLKGLGEEWRSGLQGPEKKKQQQQTGLTFCSPTGEKPFVALRTLPQRWGNHPPLLQLRGSLFGFHFKPTTGGPASFPKVSAQLPGLTALDDVLGLLVPPKPSVANRTKLAVPHMGGSSFFWGCPRVWLPLGTPPEIVGLVLWVFVEASKHGVSSTKDTPIFQACRHQGCNY